MPRASHITQQHAAPAHRSGVNASRSAAVWVASSCARAGSAIRESTSEVHPPPAAVVVAGAAAVAVPRSDDGRRPA
jgi:hypothetical protein